MNSLEERYRISQLMKQRELGVKKKKLRWNTETQVRRSLARVNNWLANGEITAREANSIIFSANLILKAIEIEETKRSE